MSFLVITSLIAPSLYSYCYTKLGAYRYVGYLNLLFLAVLIVGTFKVKKQKKRFLFLMYIEKMSL